MAAKEAKVKRLILAASSSAYGETPELPKRESMLPLPLSPYAVTKLAQEQYAFVFASSYGMETLSLRYFNVFGPRQDPTSQYSAVIPSFFDHLIKGEPPKIFGDGEQTRDFTFVGDVVEANLKAAEIKNPNGLVLNIAGGKQISINELAKKMGQLLGSKLQPDHLPARKGDIQHSVADISLAKKILGWSPKTTLEQGLSISYDWYKKTLRST
jgi:nucleoside-diphosphate-sugar epimerase